MKSHEDKNAPTPITSKIDFASGECEHLLMTNQEYIEREKITLDLREKKGKTYEASEKIISDYKKLQGIDPLQYAASAVAKHFSSKDISSVVGNDKKGEYSFDKFVEAKAGICRHHSLLLAVVLGNMVKQNVLPPGGKVHHFHGKSYELQGHNWVIYQTEHNLYLIDPTNKGNKVFDLHNKKERANAIKEYDQRKLGGVLRPLFEDKAYNLKQYFDELPSLPPLTETAAAALNEVLGKKKSDSKNNDQTVENKLGEKKLICPITEEPIRDPVYLQKRFFDGKTGMVKEEKFYFEKEALTCLLKNHLRDPLTNQEITRVWYRVPNGTKKPKWSDFIYTDSDKLGEAWAMVWNCCKLKSEDAMQLTPLPDTKNPRTYSDAWKINVSKCTLKARLGAYYDRANFEANHVLFPSFFSQFRKVNQKKNVEIAKRLLDEIKALEEIEANEKKENKQISLGSFHEKIKEIFQEVRQGAETEGHTIRSDELNHIISLVVDEDRKEESSINFFRKR